MVRGPWIASNYYRHDETGQADFDWLDTGDVALVHPDGCVEVTDRAKDVIKSGGEWISSVALEHAAAAHPDVLRVAVIAIPHPKWQERPLDADRPETRRRNGRGGDPQTPRREWSHRGGCRMRFCSSTTFRSRQPGRSRKRCCAIGIATTS